jgi:hypothetical protein
MTSTRLVVLALLLCPIALYSQEAQTPKGVLVASASPSKTQDTLSEPWRIVPPQLQFTPSVTGPFAAPTIARNDDTMCLKIRSYVVARDSKDSDSVHLVKYTTCVPANRYRLKTTELHESTPSKDSK